MALATTDEKFKMMTQEPVERLICSLAVPTIISMLVTSIYNMADTFFVSQIGTSASGAVSNRLNKPINNIPQGILKIFLKYSWPGNVRQLQNVIEQMVNMARTAALNEDLIPEEIIVANNPHFPENPLKKNEKQIILNLMQQHNHNVTNVAKQLCIARSTLYRKLKKFNINY